MKALLPGFLLLLSGSVFAAPAPGSGGPGPGMPDAPSVQNSGISGTLTTPGAAGATNMPNKGALNPNAPLGQGAATQPRGTNSLPPVNGSIATLSHQQVMDAQRALSANGLSVSTDGVAGPMTANAVRQFQSRHDLPQTGELDEQTLNALNAATQSIPTPTLEKATDTPPAL